MRQTNVKPKAAATLAHAQFARPEAISILWLFRFENPYCSEAFRRWSRNVGEGGGGGGGGGWNQGGKGGGCGRGREFFFY